MNKKVLLYLSMSACVMGTYMYTRSAKGRPKNIWQAAAQGNLAAVEKFVEKDGVDVNIVDHDKRTPLIIATDEKKLEVMNYLLQNKADVNIPDEDGDTALMHAAKEGLDNMVLAMLARDAHVNARNNKKETALMEASDEGHPGTVQLLLENAADANFVDNDGETALLKAVREYAEEMRERDSNKRDTKKRYMKVIALLVPKTNSQNLQKALKATKDQKVKKIIQYELNDRKN